MISVVGVLGCKSQQLPDPNDLEPGQLWAGDIIQRNVTELANGLEIRVVRGEITSKERDAIQAKEIGEILQSVDPTKVPSSQAWQYGDAYRMGGQWKVAESLYERALTADGTVDRKVNDTLRLSRVKAHLGKFEEAIILAKSTFLVQPSEKAPIMMAVLYEIVPEMEGKNHDEELAELLEDSIKQHEQTIVDEKSDSGKAFIKARPVHVHKAWIKAAQLYQMSGKVDDARRAILQDEESQKDRAKI